MSSKTIRYLAVLLTGLLAACSGSPFSSTPRGWRRINSSFSAQVNDLLRDSTDGNVVYAACAWQPLSESEWAGGVLRTVDGGTIWVNAHRGIPVGAEVLALAVAPPGFAGNDPALLAGTRWHGVFVSTNHAASWRSLAPDSPTVLWMNTSVRSLVAVPGKPTAVVAGTENHGVLISDDGGATWTAHNDGLNDFSIRSLVSDPRGGLLLGTWHGGVYHAADLSSPWRLEDPDLRLVSVSTAITDEAGVLWVGTQNAGLLARGPEESTTQLQGGEDLAGVGVLTIAADDDRLFVGTSGRGVFVGRFDEPFVQIEDGLENKAVSSVLLDQDRPEEILIGTWSGLYRSVPPRFAGWPALTGAAALGLAVFGYLVLWRRSRTAVAARIYRGLNTTDLDELPMFLSSWLAQLDPVNGPVILDRLASRLKKSRDYRASLFDLVRITAMLVRHLVSGRKADARTRAEIAETLDARVEALLALASRAEAGEIPQIWELSREVALRDRLFAALLRADNVAHLAALRDHIDAMEKRARDFPAGLVLNHKLFLDLRMVMEALEQLSRLASAEDRTLFLGQALTVTLGVQEKLAARQAREPQFGGKTGTVVLESIRRILASAVRDIHHRAELEVSLRSHVVGSHREAVVVLELRNVGQGHAQNLAVELQSDEASFRILSRRQTLKSLLRGQSARLEFLVEPRVSDRVRLTFRIAFDDLERLGQRLEYADVVHFVHKVDAEKTFQPLDPNPYVVGRPLLASDIFIGRKGIFDRIESSLRGTHQDNVVVLIGQRRMGKTSILRRLSQHLGDDYVPVLVDLQGLLSSGEPAFFRELVATIHDELEEAGVEVEEPPPETFIFDPGIQFRRRFLGEVRRALGQRRLLLLFDEFEVLEERIRDGDLSPRILPFFRSLMQHESRVSFMFAGTHRLDELTGDYWSVLFNLAVYLEVGHLPRDEVASLFIEPTCNAFEIDPLALDKVYRFTGGHPHFSQLLAREMVEACNEHQVSYVTVQDINRVAAEVVDKGQLHISYLWDEASRDEGLLLLGLKELLDRQGLATRQAVDRCLNDYGFPADDLPHAIRQLVRKEILDDEAGQLSFRIELLRLWMDRHDQNSLALELRGG